MCEKKSDQRDSDLKAIIEWEPSRGAAARWAAAMDMLLGEPELKEKEIEEDRGKQRSILVIAIRYPWSQSSST